MFLMYVVNEKFVKISTSGDIKLTLTNNSDKASYWTNKEKANSWMTTIKEKYPNVQLKTAKIIIV